MTFDDQLSLDLLEQVTYTSARDGGDVAQVVPHALIQDKSTHEASAGFGRYQAGDFDVAIRTAEFAGVRPKPGDFLTDAGGLRYTVLTVKVGELASFARLGCRVLAIAAELHDTVTIELPTVGAGATGAASLTYAPAYASLPARVQPDETEDTDEHGRAGTRTRYLVYLDRRLVPRNAAGTWGRVVLESDTLFLSSGSILDVRSYRDAEKLTDLPVLECVSVP